MVLRQSSRLRKSIKALDKHERSGRVFIAGQFWRPTDGDDPKMDAQEQGYGILYENGDELSVLYNGAK